VVCGGAEERPLALAVIDRPAPDRREELHERR
jgi:hypothetical protein